MIIDISSDALLCIKKLKLTICLLRPVEYEVWKQCYPPFLKKYSGFAIINCLLVMLIGKIFYSSKSTL